LVTVGETKTDLGKVVGENGANGTNGTNGDSWFSAVEIVDGNLVVTLADGETTLTLPVYNEFGIALEATSIELGGTAAVKYTVTGDSEDVVVRAYAAEGWKAAVDAKKAVVNVTAPADQALYRAGWIDVYAIDNETGKVVAKSMTFSNEGTTLKVDEKVVVPAAGAEAIEVAVSTDYVYDVECEAEWLTLVPATKAVRNETLVFKAVANKSGANRTAEVNLTVDGVVKATVVFEQRALATAMTVTPAEAVLVIGDASIDFNAVVTPADADQAVTYAVLGEDGKPSTNLIFVGSELMLNDAEGSEDYLNVMPGEYTVVVTSVSNPEVKVEVPVEVKAILVEEIKVASELVRVKIGQTVALDYTVLPADASDKTVKFVSSDENIITVDENGVVHAQATGETTLTMTAKEYSEEIAVTVVPKVTSIEGIDEAISLTTGDTLTLEPKLKPDRFKDEPVTFKTGDDKVATVTKEGVLTAVAAGETKLTVESDGCKFKASVSVADPVIYYAPSTSSKKKSSGSSGSSKKKSSSKASKGYFDSSDDEHF
jgi:hypothetical protein